MKIGCSSFSWETKDNKHLLGRTYDEFGDLRLNKIAVVPRNYNINLEINGEEGASATGKYAFCGMAVLGLATPIMVDGINEKGLMGALLNYPGYAAYNTRQGEGLTQIHPGFLITYLLSQCASVAEAAECMEKINLSDEPVYGEEMQVHYILSDPTGETIIIEPDEGGISVYRETIGVLTNSPGYLWHRTNLRNYVAVTNLNKPPQTIVNFEISEFGERLGGGFGLPGDYSPPARFVKMAFLKEFAVKGKDEVQGVTKMFHNFAPVDTPEGILKADPRHDVYEQTLCISVMCAESLTYYYSVCTNRRICAVCLDREKDNAEIKHFDLQEEQDICYINR